MRRIFIALIVLLIIFSNLAAAVEPVINPSVESQPIACRIIYTKWLCDIFGSGSGSGGTVVLSGSGNTTNYFNLSASNLTSISNMTNFFTVTYSEMNQTPNMTAGPQGLQGIQGIQGPAGEQGPPGEQGVQGIPGINGTDGAPGEQGPQGIQGIQGEIGPEGPQGEQGPIGLPNMTAGPQGPAGEQGPPGAANMTAGPQGEQGPQGIQGIQGPAGEIPDSTQFLFLNGTRAMTGNLSMGSHYVNGVLNPSIGTDAVNKNYVDSIPVWYTYTPTLTWSGTTPTGSTSSYEYSVINKTVFFAYYITYSDSKGSSLTYATLPINVTADGAYIYVFTGFEQYGDPFGSLSILPTPWAYPADAGRLRFLSSMAGTNGRGIRYVITGFYHGV